MDILTHDLTTSDLRYTQERDLVITRQKQGKGFRYFDKKGNPITDPQKKKYVNSLAIPPAWNNVHISTDPSTHIQAIGHDDRDRKQYIYHSKWNELRKQHKFEKMVFFGKLLPDMRRKVRSDMNLPGLSREKVVATVVWLLEHTFIRVGNTEYAQQNDTYGLTTIQNQHVKVKGDTVRFHFMGKSGIEHDVEIEDPQVAQVIHSCEELPEQELFEYIDENGNRKDVSSSDVNDYLRQLSGEDITAKDFRTWGGTVLAADTLHELGLKQKKYLKKHITEAVKEVAAHLRNTPATARTYYIHPFIPKSYQESILVPHFESMYSRGSLIKYLHRNEHATWTLLQKETDK